MVLFQKEYSFRISEWWHSKIAMFSSYAFLFALFADLSLQEFAGQYLKLLAWYISAAGFGYFINDIFDSESDARAGKANKTLGISKSAKWFWALFLMTAQLLAFYFIIGGEQLYLFVLPVGNIVLFLFYSLPHVRLKEKPFIDLITDALYAQVLPISITFIAIIGWSSPYNLPLVLALFLWSLISGIRNILEHQVLDYDYDLKSGVNNTVQYFGLEKATVLVNRFMIFAELIAFAVLLVIIGFHSSVFSYSMLALMFMAFFLSPIGENILPQTKAYRKENFLNFRLIYEAGIFFAAVISFLWYQYYPFLAFTMVHLVLFRNEVLKWFVYFLYKIAYRTVMLIYHDFIIGFLYYKVILSLSIFLFYKVILRIWIIFKILVNYSIYYFRRIVLRYDKKRAKGE